MSNNMALTCEAAQQSLQFNMKMILSLHTMLKDDLYMFPYTFHVVWNYVTHFLSCQRRITGLLRSRLSDAHFKFTGCQEAEDNSEQFHQQTIYCILLNNMHHGKAKHPIFPTSKSSGKKSNLLE
jgi:hypothetical protein